MKKVIETIMAINLMARIAIGILVGAILGLVIPKVTFIGFFGTLFIGALKAMAPILVFFLVASSISKAGSSIGKKFRNVIFLYMLSTIVAAFIAVFVYFMVPITVALNATDLDSAAPQSLTEIFENLLKSIVENPVSAMAGANYLGILFWAIVIGFGLKMIGDETTNYVIEKIAEALSKVISVIQDSLEAALNSSSDVAFTAVAEKMAK